MKFNKNKKSNEYSHVVEKGLYRLKELIEEYKKKGYHNKNKKSYGYLCGMIYSYNNFKTNNPFKYPEKPPVWMDDFFSLKVINFHEYRKYFKDLKKIYYKKIKSYKN